jgi:hypothetical protein
MEALLTKISTCNNQARYLPVADRSWFEPIARHDCKKHQDANSMKVQSPAQ